MINRKSNQESPINTQYLVIFLVPMLGTFFMGNMVSSEYLLFVYFLLLLGPFMLIGVTLIQVGMAGFILGVLLGIALRMYSCKFWNRHLVNWEDGSLIALTVTCQILLTGIGMLMLWYGINVLE